MSGIELRSRAELRNLVVVWDLRAYGLSRWYPWYAFRFPTLRYQRVLRRTERWMGEPYLHAHLMYLYWRLRLRHLGIRMGLSIPPGVFGPGLSIPHYGSIVVNDKVRAGAFCRIHSATNIGENGGSAPVIGDGVYLAPGSVVYGAANIGSRSVVAANSVVGVSAPSGSLIAGVPAKVRFCDPGVYDRAMPSWIVEALDSYAESALWLTDLWLRRKSVEADHTPTRTQ
jgi:serine O-acetyltransferase